MCIDSTLTLWKIHILLQGCNFENILFVCFLKVYVAVCFKDVHNTLNRIEFVFSRFIKPQLFLLHATICFFSVCHAVRWYVKKQCCISCSICQSCRPVSHESIWLFIQFCLIRAGLLKPHLWFWPTGLSGEGHCWVSSVQTAVKTFDYWVFEWLKIYKLDFRKHSEFCF